MKSYVASERQESSEATDVAATPSILPPSILIVLCVAFDVYLFVEFWRQINQRDVLSYLVLITSFRYAMWTRLVRLFVKMSRDGVNVDHLRSLQTILIGSALIASLQVGLAIHLLRMLTNNK